MSRRLTLMIRALKLRCPNCDGRGVFKNWFTMKNNCPHCGVSLVLGNPVGANLLNLVASEVLLMIVLAIIITQSAEVPWTFLTYGAPALMVLAPMTFFPFSKLLFVAFDLSMYPEGKPDSKAHY